MTARTLRRMEPLWSSHLDEDETSWRDSALCAQSDSEAWFPEKGASTAYAKKVCRGCPVKAECLQFALRNGERFGVWGGMSERERRKIALPTRCNVPAGHKRCSKCEVVKPLDAFHRKSDGKGGRTGKCASCRNSEDKQRARTRIKVAA